MPNHVYARIIISDPTKKQKEILKKIEKAEGLCRYYKPMPKELEGTTADGIQHSWYEWCLENWGTKWGCYEFEIEDNIISFTSAWGPIGLNIIQMFAKDFPSFHYSFEEENEWGAEFDYENGESVFFKEYDEPEWDESIEFKEYEITRLLVEHPNYPDGRGYYVDYSRDYLGKTLQQAKEELTKEKQILKWHQ